VKAGLEFKNTLQIDPKFPDGYYMLGMTQLMRGDLPHADGSFNKAVELEPDHLQAQIQLGKILVAAGKRDEAMEKAEHVLKKEPVTRRPS
jgi:cytochrome c-type biogenesis protein CcmH/NrfG